MSIASFPADLLHLVTGSGSRLRPVAAFAALAVAVITGVLYALPLSQDAENVVSNVSFTTLLVLVMIGSVSRALASTGAHRLAWFGVSAAFAITGTLFAGDPALPNEHLTVALHVAVLPSIAFWAAVVALAAPALPGLASVRAAADALWITTAAVVAVWPWTIDPLIEIEGRTDLQVLLHLAFAFSTIALSTTVLVILPHTAGRGRVGLWFLGVGGAITSLAGVFHIRFHYEGTLRFGTAWDYLWTIGLTALVLSSVVTREGELRHRSRGLRWNALMTVIPLVLTIPALLRDHEGRGADVAAVTLLAVLGVRVLALLAENDRLTASLRRQAHNDPLTGLGNRRALDAGIARVGELAEASGRRRAVAVVDLDHFKDVNDTHGHPVGDEVLRLVARRLRDAVRGRDVLARHGGDEFMVVMSVRHEREAIRAAERLRAAVEGRYALAAQTVEIGATIGVALDDGTGAADVLIAAADVALYEAKGEGRGTIRMGAASV